MIYPVILSGGSGTRLWPLSRATYPKQFLSLMGEDSLLQQTVLRFYGRPDFAAPAIIANNDHRFLVAEQLRSADIEGASIILEPVARNTGPAAIVAALHVHNTDPNGVVVLLSSDAAIRDVDGLHSALAVAAQAAQAGKLVTFGMEADRPETGYGYIKQGTSLDGVTGAFTVARFVENPISPVPSNAGGRRICLEQRYVRVSSKSLSGRGCLFGTGDARRLQSCV